MAWSATLIGGAIGLLGGPIGCGIGAGIGRMIDNSSEEDEKKAQAAAGAQAQSRQLFFVATYGSLAKMAKADGVVTQDEIAAVDHFMREVHKLNAEDRRWAQEIFKRAKDDDQFSVSDILRQFAESVQDYALREFQYRLLFIVAMADGKLHPAEVTLLREAAAALRLPPSIFDAFCHEFGVGAAANESDLDAHFQILGLTSAASAADIKKAYRQKVQDFHPDKLAAKGLPDSLLKLAEDEFKKVQQAYEICLKSMDNS